MLIQPFSRLSIITSFHLNRDFIIQNLCENKAKPELECAGKCYLKKKIQAAEKEVSNEKNTKKISLESNIFLVEMPKISFNQLISYQDFPTTTNIGKPLACLVEILQPPQI